MRQMTTTLRHSPELRNQFRIQNMASERAQLDDLRHRQGRLVANVYAIDTYNGYFVTHNQEEFDEKANASTGTGIPLGIEMHREFAQKMGVPFAVSEWSNNGDPQDAGKGGEEPSYVAEMNAWFRANAGDLAHPQPGQLIYEVQFNLQDQFSFWPTKFQPKTAAEYRSLVWGH